MARLDSLGPTKRIAQLASVLGRDFAYGLLEDVSAMPPAELRAGLDDAERAGLLLRRGSPPVATYTFKHALVRDAAYGSMLQSTRRRHHGAVARVLAERSPELAAANPELVAQHAVAGDRAELATDWFERAGRQDLRRAAYREAVVHLRAAIESNALLGEGAERDRREARLQNLLGNSLQAAEGYSSPGVEAACSRARELSILAGETDELAASLQGLAGFYQASGMLEASLESAGELQQLGVERAEVAYESGAAFLLAGTTYFQGDFEAACHHAQRGIAVRGQGDPEQLLALFAQDPGVVARLLPRPRAS